LTQHRVIPGPTENIADHLLDDAKISVFKYIETFYNPVRRHQTLEYQSPDQFERKQKMPLVSQLHSAGVRQSWAIAPPLCSRC
jgi:hypothetical protein